MKFYKTDFDECILQQYEHINLELYKNDAEWKIAVFINLHKTQEELKSMWSDVSSSIASVYQANLLGKENEFEKWNIYIIYLCEEVVDKDLKYKIENDKFSSRKIIEDNYTSIKPNSIQKIIEKHITNTDLNIKSLSTNNLLKDYSPKTNLWKAVNKPNILKGDTDKQIKMINQLLKIESHES